MKINISKISINNWMEHSKNQDTHTDFIQVPLQRFSSHFSLYCAYDIISLTNQTSSKTLYNMQNIIV